MKNWKKLLACLLVGLMALTVFTACDASVGAPMGAKRSNAESKSVKALCTRFGVTYDKELSEKAYYIAYWVAGTSQSCWIPEKTELYRYDNVDNVAKTYLKQGDYAYAFDSMGIGKGIGGGMGVTVDDNGVCTYCSMRAGAMARYPQRYKSCEEYLVGKKLSWETMLGCLPIMHDQVYEANKSRPSVFYKKESIQGVYKHLFADVLRKLNIEEVQGF